jgi:hypothetical protein
MCFAVEFLSGPRVLMLRVYGPLKPAERRAAVQSVKVHGCYRPRVPLLLDSTETESPNLMIEVCALRASLASALPDSPIAIVVPPASRPPDESLRRDGPVFTARADALDWLTGPWFVQNPVRNGA